jgi:hypothetical protein
MENDRAVLPVHRVGRNARKDQKEEIVSEIEKAWLERFGGQTTRVGR